MTDPDFEAAGLDDPGPSAPRPAGGLDRNMLHLSVVLLGLAGVAGILLVSNLERAALKRATAEARAIADSLMDFAHAAAQPPAGPPSPNGHVPGPVPVGVVPGQPAAPEPPATPPPVTRPRGQAKAATEKGGAPGDPDNGAAPHA